MTKKKYPSYEQEVAQDVRAVTEEEVLAEVRGGSLPPEPIPQILIRGQNPPMGRSLPFGLLSPLRQRRELNVSPNSAFRLYQRPLLPDLNLPARP